MTMVPSVAKASLFERFYLWSFGSAKSNTILDKWSKFERKSPSARLVTALIKSPIFRHFYLGMAYSQSKESNVSSKVINQIKILLHQEMYMSRFSK